MEDLKTVELVIDETNERYEVNAISLVDEPAIEEDFIAFNKEKVMFKEVDNEKRILVGLALVPDKLILRKNEEGYYNVVMSKETVSKASHLYLKRLHNHNTTTDHKELVEGVSVVESWIVEDTLNDKVNFYGLSPIEGAWAVKMKVDNDEVWEDVKQGKYMGFSIEGIFKPMEEQESNFSKEDLTDEELLEGIINVIKDM